MSSKISNELLALCIFCDWIALVFVAIVTIDAIPLTTYEWEMIGNILLFVAFFIIAVAIFYGVILENVNERYR